MKLRRERTEISRGAEQASVFLSGIQVSAIVTSENK